MKTYRPRSTIATVVIMSLLKPNNEQNTESFPVCDRMTFNMISCVDQTMTPLNISRFPELVFQDGSQARSVAISDIYLYAFPVLAFNRRRVTFECRCV